MPGCWHADHPLHGKGTAGRYIDFVSDDNENNELSIKLTVCDFYLCGNLINKVQAYARTERTSQERNKLNYVHRCETGGIMRAYHAAGPGSIPGRNKFPG